MSLKKYIQFSTSFFSFFLFISMLFSVSSIFWTTDTIYSVEEKKDVRLGFPVDFIGFDHSREDIVPPPETLGFRTYSSFIIDWKLLLTNVGIIFLVFSFVLYCASIKYKNILHILRLCSLKNIIIGCFIFLLSVIIWFWTQSMLAKNAPPLSPELMQPPLLSPKPIQPVRFER